MNKKESLIAIICIIVVASLAFFAGTRYKNAMLEYQLRVKVSFSPDVKDSITLYNGSRKVGTVPLTYGEPFAELILSDIENK